ncbi:MAG: ethanolamine ammonia-lyase subunit EutC [Terracidiphilus sp.]
MNEGLHRPVAFAARLRALTPARVGLGRTGASLQTCDLLDFQRAHAQARDAVHARLDASSLAANLAAITGQDVLVLHSTATDRTTYLQRPDLGRQLDETSRAKLLIGNWELALILADGLSAIAVERHAPPLLQELLPRLEGWRLAPIAVVEQGRVAIGDEIGAALGAQLSVVLIGERPGLSSPDSLGAYITWNPGPGRTNAERNCISNIRIGGLSYITAATQLSYYLTEARRRQLTGISLKDGSLQLNEG